jgi:transposase InsO family protein
MAERYRACGSRKVKGELLDELERVAGYTRKHAITVMNGSSWRLRGGKRSGRPRAYRHCLPAVEAAWEALDYCCAERLHPHLVSVAEALARHGELRLTREAREELACISRATLARRLEEMPRGKPRLWLARRHPSRPLSSEVPVDRYPWNETRPGALEIDLVDHSGGLGGHHAYTLSVVDVVSGWSRRRAVMGRGQRVVHEALAELLSDWPSEVWALHSDNGSEFLSAHLIAYCRSRGVTFHRSRPYQKNDNAHVEQKNRQLVREVVGYDRIDTRAGLAWLNAVYDALDPYANVILPNLKVIHKSRHGSKIRKRYDTAKTPLQRLQKLAALLPEQAAELAELQRQLNPLALRRALDRLQRQGPADDKLAQAAD